MFAVQLNVLNKHLKCGKTGRRFVCLKLEGSENLIKVNSNLLKTGKPKVEAKIHPVKLFFFF